MADRSHGRTRDLSMWRSQLAARLEARLAPDGSLQDRCDSRVLETALLLRLLQKAYPLSDVQTRLRRQVASGEPHHDVERIIQQAIVSGQSQDAEAEAFIRGFRHSTGERKTILLATLLRLAGATTADRFGQREPFRRGGAIWTDLALCAITIIRDRQRNRQVRDDQRFLVSLLRDSPTSRVWQGNLLAHLLGLHALRTFAADHPLLRGGVAALVDQINPDGGIPFIDGQDIWISALAGAALTECGTATEATGALADFIAARQLDDGGWGYSSSTTQSDVDDTSRCMCFLHAVDSSGYADTLRRGRDYLVNIAGADGGFPTYVRGHRSEADLTAGAVLALTAVAPANGPVLRRAIGFLVAAQHSDGSFDPSWTQSQSSVIAHAVQALDTARQRGVHASPDVGTAIARSVNFLIRQQNADGGWGQRSGQPSDILSTSHAVQALAGRAPAGLLAGAGDYLVRRLEGTGLRAPADQIGPRPLPYRFPVLAGVHCLSALNLLCGNASSESPIGNLA